MLQGVLTAGPAAANPDQPSVACVDTAQPPTCAATVAAAAPATPMAGGPWIK